MKKFDFVENGYSSSQVDAYLSIITKKYEEKIAELTNENYTLRNELEKNKVQLGEYEQKERQISKAFITAVEKAEEIENHAKELAHKEIDKLKSMYEKWENLLKEAEEQTSFDGSSEHIKEAIKNFQDNIKEYTIESLSTEKNGIKAHLKKHSNDYIRNILNKMDYMFSTSEKTNEPTQTITVKPFIEKVEANNQLTSGKTALHKEQDASRKEISDDKKEGMHTIHKVDMTEIMAEHIKENNRIASIGGRLQNLNQQVKKVKCSNLADEFLNSDDEINNAYAKTFEKKRKTPKELDFAYPEPNESGFDLKEALNPHDNLETIMSAFDFYQDTHKS